MKKIYFVILILCIIGVFLYISFYINKDDTVFIDMKIPEGYIKKENLTVSEWKHGLFYLKLVYPHDISNKINEDIINDGIDKLKINQGIDRLDLKYFKKIEQDYVIQVLLYNYEKHPNIYDNHIHDILEDLKAYTFECYGYNTDSILSYYLYDLDNYTLHLIRIIS